MRTSDRKLNPSLKRQIVKAFAQTLGDFKNLKEGEIFINNFFTEAEIETFAKRLAVAYWLKKGRSYSNIRENLKVSSATIADVSPQVDNPGFSLAIKKIEAEEWANQWADKIKKIIGD